MLFLHHLRTCPLTSFHYHHHSFSNFYLLVLTIIYILRFHHHFWFLVLLLSPIYFLVLSSPNPTSSCLTISFHHMFIYDLLLYGFTPKYLLLFNIFPHVFCFYHSFSYIFSYIFASSAMMCPLYYLSLTALSLGPSIYVCWSVLQSSVYIWATFLFLLSHKREADVQFSSVMFNSFATSWLQHTRFLRLSLKLRFTKFHVH